MNCLIKKKRINLIKVTFYPENHTFPFLILLIYHLINVFFYFPGAYSRKYTAVIKTFF